MIINRIRNKIKGSPNGGRLRFIYLGFSERKELFNYQFVYKHVDFTGDAHRFDGLEIVRVEKESHLEVV